MFGTTITPVSSAKAILPSLVRKASSGIEVLFTVNGSARVALVNVDEDYELYKLIKKAKSSPPLDIREISKKLNNGKEGINFKSEEDIVLWWQEEKKNKN